ncbi:MAG: serine/threonine protein kinase [Phycisphaerales bacterium]|nr:serine/threonine protein kinase [Phycisphaerales bacterium]
MNEPSLFERARSVFDQVCDAKPEERASILKKLCGADDVLRREVEVLLAHDASVCDVVEAAEMGGGARALADAVAGHTTHDERALETIGPYRVIRKIGEGGMGIIYEAQQESPRRRVALKILRAGMIGREMLKRFQHEAHILGQLQHPGIAHIHEAGIAQLPRGHQPFFAMEFIDGEPLDRYADKHHLDLKQRMELLARVGVAVHHAHQKGIIHRDLKPSNVLVVHHEDGGSTGSTHNRAATGSIVDLIGQPKVLDFGIARVTDADIQAVTVQTEVGQLVGTLAYMSPEQVTGTTNDLDTRCDVYALGVILYELLAGYRPHDLSGLPVTEAVRRIREDEPKRLGTINRRLRGDIETIVGKAMEKDRDRRYGSAAELAADIRRYLTGAPIDARPASTFYQLTRFAKRNTGLVAGVFAAILALTVGLVLATLSAHRANQATRLAEQEGERARQALADVELVADFQGAIVKSANMQEMGNLILNEVATQLGKGKSMTDVGTLLEELNPASIARAVVDGSLLDRASETARVQFSDRPALEADIHDSLADTYFAIGMYEQSLREAKTALALRREHLGGDHPDTIKMIGNVCHLLNNLGRPEEAEPYANEALRRLREIKPDDDESVLEAEYRVVFTLRGLNKFDEALEVSRELVRKTERVLAPNDERSYMYRQQLGTVYSELGRLEESLAIREELLDAYRQNFDENGVRVLGCWSQVAMTLNRLGRLEESEAAFAEVVSRAEETLGESDPRSLLVLGNLASVQAKRGHTEKARETYQLLLNRQQKALPPGDPAIAQTIQALDELKARLDNASTTSSLEPPDS